MCYETSLAQPKEKIVKRFKADFLVKGEYSPSYRLNGFDHPNLQIIIGKYPNDIVPATWGLVPEWATENMETFEKEYGDFYGFWKKYNTLNARGEDMLQSNTYKKAARYNRCLIIADGFYEPHQVGVSSIPHYCYIPDKKGGRKLFAFAGLYSKIDQNLVTCSIVTTEANEFFGHVHNARKRMPLVLDKTLEKEWLRYDLNEDCIRKLVTAGFSDEEFKAHPVAKGKFDNETAIVETYYQELDTLF